MCEPHLFLILHDDTGPLETKGAPGPPRKPYHSSEQTIFFLAIITAEAF